mmetsp:Transcript_66419/g.185076  ORF Transcript_66419/g.185076 Transcript_66419/m.185076 type:complete len:229 (+) Transcript_66419:170-856(+)
MSTGVADAADGDAPVAALAAIGETSVPTLERQASAKVEACVDLLQNGSPSAEPFFGMSPFRTVTTAEAFGAVATGRTSSAVGSGGAAVELEAFTVLLPQSNSSVEPFVGMSPGRIVSTAKAFAGAASGRPLSMGRPTGGAVPHEASMVPAARGNTSAESFVRMSSGKTVSTGEAFFGTGMGAVESRGSPSGAAASGHVAPALVVGAAFCADGGDLALSLASLVIGAGV